MYLVLTLYTFDNKDYVYVFFILVFCQEKKHTCLLLSTKSYWNGLTVCKSLFQPIFQTFHETMLSSIATVLGFRLYLTLRMKTALEAIANRCHWLVLQKKRVAKQRIYLGTLKGPFQITKICFIHKMGPPVRSERVLCEFNSCVQDYHQKSKSGS